MKRMHVHLNVEDLDQSVRFYRTLFGAAPSKLKRRLRPVAARRAGGQLRPLDAGSAATSDSRGGVSHLGIQVDDDDSLADITRALTDAEQAIFEEKENLCCYAKGNKTWASDPDGVVWETFHRLDHSETVGRGRLRATPRSTPCTNAPRYSRPPGRLRTARRAESGRPRRCLEP